MYMVIAKDDARNILDWDIKEHKEVADEMAARFR